jgi:PGF-pre-PGF domain-containing protein
MHKNANKIFAATALALALAFGGTISGPAAAATGYGGMTIYPNNNNMFSILASADDFLTLGGLGSILTSIQLFFNGEFTGEFQAVVSTSLPSGAAMAPTGVVYYYFDLMGEAMNSSLASATVRFSVPKSWLDANGIAKENLHLHHYSGGAWQTLTTQITSETATEVNYAATTNSFSPFAVAGTVSNPPTGGGAGTNDVTTAPTGDNLYLLLAGAAGLAGTGGWLMLKARQVKK